jgi:hypothetical protein
LLIITKIPEKIDASETKVNKEWFEPLVKVSFKRYKSNIKILLKVASEVFHKRSVFLKNIERFAKYKREC